MEHLGTLPLETQRLILRKTLESDYEPMFRNWANDERVTRFLNWQPYTLHMLPSKKTIQEIAKNSSASNLNSLKNYI